jgi:hypothetical protein
MVGPESGQSTVDPNVSTMTASMDAAIGDGVVHSTLALAHANPPLLPTMQNYIWSNGEKASNSIK